MKSEEFRQRKENLTTEQWEVLKKLLKGKTDLEIASSLKIEITTLRKHVERIYRVLGLSGEERKPRRIDLLALFAKYEPELLKINGEPGMKQIDIYKLNENRKDLLGITKTQNVPGNLLELLATNTRDKRILKAIARNPNTPLNSLVELSKDYLKEIGQNPALELILLENPGFIERIYYRVSLPGFHNDTIVPSWYYELAYRDNNFRVRAFVASNKNTPVRLLKKLSKDPFGCVRDEVASNKKTPINILKEMATSDLSYEVRRSAKISLAESFNTPIEMLEELSENCDFGIRLAVSKNVKTPNRILIKLSQDYDDWVREGVAENVIAPTKLLESLSRDLNENIRLAVAKNPMTSKYILEELTRDPFSLVRAEVARNSFISLQTILKLANDPSNLVREGVAKNIKTPDYILEKMAEDSDEIVRAGVAQNPFTPANILELLSQDEDLQVIIEVAKNPFTPKDTLKKLTSFEIYAVQYSAIESIKNKSSWNFRVKKICKLSFALGIKYYRWLRCWY